MKPNFSFLIQGTSNKLTFKIVSFLTPILLIYLFEKKEFNQNMKARQMAAASNSRTQGRLLSLAWAIQ